MDEKSYWLGFSAVYGIGPARFKKLVSFFGDAKTAWFGSIIDLKQSGIGENTALHFADFRKTFSIASYEEALNKKNVYYLTISSEDYPKHLSLIKNPPFVLYVKTSKEAFDFNAPKYQRSIAVVGTRKITDYGKEVTKLFTRDLVSAGCVIVSGLALGVDALTHTTTVDAGGKTVAVLGCGVDCCYPQENIHVYRKILESGGAIVSEYGLGIPPNQGSFPSRNRIIAGLSLGVVVTEGAIDSGSLITAHDALKNNRPVFAVPGPITSSLSKGPYELISQGGKLVVSAKDILAELGFEVKGLSRLRSEGQSFGEPKGDTQEEQLIIDLLQIQNMHFDELVRSLKIDSSEIGSLLSLMEMKGIVKSLPSGFFCMAGE